MKIAVVGAGIAGITAAYILGRRHDVTLIERNDYVGGHTNTIAIDDPAGPLQVDTGFIVCNPRTYPNFYKLLGEWGVDLRDTDMSFGFSCQQSGIGYVGPSVTGFLRKPSNLFNLKLLGMIREQRRFGRRASDDLARDTFDGCSLGTYLERIGVSQFFIDHYLLPTAASVWSSPDREMLRYPAQSFIRFFKNHGLLDLSRRPTWQTVIGGSQTYVSAFREKFRGRIMTSTPVTSVVREDDGATVQPADGDPMRFDGVVMATHADVTLDLLSDASERERDALTAWTYHRNVVQLHDDPSVMPADRRLWASWNYHRGPWSSSRALLTMTYDMKRLQGLRTDRDYLVSLNAADRIDPARVIRSFEYMHPGFTERSTDAQAQLLAMNGERSTWYCGAHLRYGFHEDGVVSAMNAARQLGVEL